MSVLFFPVGVMGNTDSVTKDSQHAADDDDDDASRARPWTEWVER